MKNLVYLPHDVFSAWQLLTSIPLPFELDFSDRPLGRAAAHFPLVGLVLGGLLAGAGQLLYSWLPEGLAAALLLAVWVGLTGLLHLDGFMDSCDGLLPPRDPEQRLEIMRDSRVGAFGVVGVILLLLIKFNGLAALPAGDRAVGLIAIPVLARWSMTWGMARYPSAREAGMSVLFKAGLGWLQVGVASIVAVAVAVGLMGWGGFVLLGITWLTTTLIARLSMVRISGLTGDVYGAICEMVETALLILIVLLS